MVRVDLQSLSADRIVHVAIKTVDSDSVAPSTSSGSRVDPVPPCVWRALLVRHGDLKPFFRRNQVVPIVQSRIELHPTNLSPKGAGAAGVVLAHRRSAFLAHIGGFVAREEHGDRSLDAPVGD